MATPTLASAPHAPALARASAGHSRSQLARSGVCVSSPKMPRVLQGPTNASRPGRSAAIACRADGGCGDEPSDAVSRRSMLAAAAVLAIAPQMPAVAANLPAGARMPTKEEKAAIDKAMKKVAPKTKGPVLLRLIFHDAGTYDKASGTGGANGSVQFELKRPENKGLGRGTRIVEALQKELQGTAAAGLSFADGIALLAAHSVAICGGPTTAMPIGRLDVTEADPEGRMPEESLSAEDLRGVFARMGFTTQEFVALSGAHTLGAKGFGEPLEFSNEYYRALTKKPWENKEDEMAAMIGLASDHVLPDDPPSREWIDKYAADQDLFYKDFSAALTKLSCSGAKFA